MIFISGIGLASFLPLKILHNDVWWFGAAVFFLALAVWFWPNKIFLLAAVFWLALWRYGASLPADAPDKIWRYNGRTAAVRGYAAGESDIRETNQKLEIAAEWLNLSAGGSIPVSGKILATADLYPEYNYGDELELECELKQPEQYQGFAYDRYLARYNIYSTCYYPKIKIIGKNRGRIFYAKIFALKGKIAGIIDAGMSEPESSLARPIVFGGQRGVEPSIKQNFQKTGLTHIMAVSGFNVSIIAAVVLAVLLGAGISRRYAFYAAAAMLAGYIVLVGMPASAMRAGLMGFLVLWALKLGRLNKITNSLVLAAALLLLANPRLLRDDVGFQLSFLALAGLVYVYPILEALWQKIKLPKLKGASDGLLITLAAQAFTLPILAYNFSQISLIAPLANLAVLWTLPILTVLILIAIPLSWAIPGLSFIFFLPSLILTKYILAAVKYLAALPFSYLEVDYLWPGWAVVYYAVIIYSVIKLRRSKLLKPEINGKI
ncbi:MAG: ComEC/Rec2 family competence protein [bacterium]|nr:ComEC/Rec2 family competence protein [bacterium]